MFCIERPDIHLPPIKEQAPQKDNQGDLARFQSCHWKQEKIVPKVGGEKEEINQKADLTGWRSGQAETPVSRLDVGFQTSAPT